MQIQEASMEMTGMALDKDPNQFKGDENLRVQFSKQPHFNPDKSNAEGRPIYDETTYVTIIVPGQQDIVFRKAWRQDYDRFAKQYAAFLNNTNQDAASGTPLKVLTWLTQSQVKELEFFNVYTVEQLANMPDSTAGRFMALQQLKTRAKDYLVAAKEQAPLTAIRAELDEKDNKIEVMQRQLNELLARIGEMEDKAA